MKFCLLQRSNKRPAVVAIQPGPSPGLMSAGDLRALHFQGSDMSHRPVALGQKAM